MDVRLKRKVLSTETKLFEWRPCICSVVGSDGNLLLQLQTPLDEDEQEDNAETVVVDLASQLLSIVPKKNKARCDLEYYASASGSIGDILKEELMAPSAAQCQQWIAQVLRSQQQAQQKQQRRPGSTASSPRRPLSAPSPVTPLPSSLLPPRRTAREMSGSELQVPQEAAYMPPSPPKRQSSSLSSSSVSYTMPDHLAAVARAGSFRDRSQCDQTAIDGADLDTVDSSSCSPAMLLAPRADPHQSAASPVSSAPSAAPRPTAWRRGVPSPDYSSSSESEVLRSSSRRHKYRSDDFGNNDHGSDDDDPSRFQRRSFRQGSVRDYPPLSGRLNLASSSLSRGSPPRNCALRSGWRDNSPLARADADEGDGESSRAELHILQRVESALRALELENAQFKARERELTQEIQTLRDTARVTAAERKHTEQEFRHARREIDSWRRAAQSAEAAAAQLQEQLGIAREENQLLASERLRLKRQNGELLTQVHRLDSLVYGRF